VLVLEAEQTDKLANELAVPPTDDAAKYDWKAAGSGPKMSVTLKAIWDGKNFLQEAAEGTLVGLIFDKTNFYAEAGGQLFDMGRVTTADGSVVPILNCQKFGAYILHSGSLGAGAMKVGDEVELDVDYERRSHIAANHTSTHLLNWALRKVLAGSLIDQRGSIVAPDKLRFDFSYGKPMKTEEVAQVQNLVREIIAGGYDIHKQECALPAAKQVKTLRAVFGEVYPDPVRVVTVGPVDHTIDKLLADPENEQWNSLSVEFCGGTHMDNTKEASTFAIIGEEGTAKGVRRLVAVTKDAARVAQEAANDFDKRVERAGELTDTQALDEEVSKMRKEVDEITMDYVRKDAIKAAIDKLKEKVLAAEKELIKAKTEGAVEWAKSLDVAGKPFMVEVVDVEGDVKAMDAAMKVINTAAPDTPVCFLSKSAKGDKVSCLAVVPKAVAGKLDAKDWINVALEQCGGKGGGKPDRAQGAAKDASKFAAALEAAKGYPAGKV